MPDLATHDINTAFSAVIRSCNGRNSVFPARDGMVELWAIFVAAVLNMMAVDKQTLFEWQGTEVSAFILVSCETKPTKSESLYSS